MIGVHLPISALMNAAVALGELPTGSSPRVASVSFIENV
jgi:hypothetical protein